MKKATINGVNVYVEARSNEVPYGFMTTGLFCYKIGNGTKKDIVKASGTDEGKIDYALPQDWVDDKVHGGMSYEDINYYVWQYGDSLFGKPLDLRNLASMVATKAIAEILA